MLIRPVAAISLALLARYAIATPAPVVGESCASAACESTFSNGALTCLSSSKICSLACATGYQYSFEGGATTLLTTCVPLFGIGEDCQQDSECAALPNATPSCFNGQYGLTCALKCKTGFKANAANNGCISETTASVGESCASAACASTFSNGVLTCLSSSKICSLACATGYQYSFEGGATTLLTTCVSLFGIGEDCQQDSECAALPNATPSCFNGQYGLTCALKCKTGFKANAANNGCISETTASVGESCASAACASTFSNGVLTCLSSSKICSLACATGYQYSFEGGATTLLTTCVSLFGIGEDCQQDSECAALPNATPSCFNGQYGLTCALKCKTGFKANAGNNGCISDTAASVGESCAAAACESTFSNGVLTCLSSSKICSLACTTGYQYSFEGGATTLLTTCVPLFGIGEDCQQDSQCAALPNATPSCFNGQYGLTCALKCKTGFKANAANNGCISETTASVGESCAAAACESTFSNGVLTCLSSSKICSLACTTGYQYSFEGGATTLLTTCVPLFGIGEDCQQDSECAALPNATPSCFNGVYGLTCALKCKAGFRANAANNGCISDTAASVGESCASAACASSFSNGALTCLSSSKICSLACATGYQYSFEGGATTLLTTCVPLFGIGEDCQQDSECAALPNATPSCFNGQYGLTCALKCKTGFKANAGNNGCISDTAASVGESCAAAACASSFSNGALTCLSSSKICSLACTTGYQYSFEGGATTLLTTCVPLFGIGEDCQQDSECAALPNATPSCFNGQYGLTCALKCKTGFKANAANNGCISETTASVGESCASAACASTFSNGVLTCLSSSKICSLACATGYQYSFEGGATTLLTTCVPLFGIGEDCQQDSQCAALPNATPSCFNGQYGLTCALKCKTGFKANAANNGCISETTASVGESCASAACASTFSNGVLTCLSSSKICSLACATGYQYSFEGGATTLLTTCVSLFGIGEDCQQDSECAALPNATPSCFNGQYGLTCALKCKTGFKANAAN
ncbi:hypothetical protein BDR26DRAFT_1003569 [Obelidium mucronatum]|nr:hypothetical protein BDR26DRAFT_1003569 [Obelidium mucronatum]